MSDDGFHEIQLNGKQLVFLFMATTVVSVVIFLCGVLVGRGIPPGGATAMVFPGVSAAEEVPPPDVDPGAAAPVTPPAGLPSSQAEALEYPSVLTGSAAAGVPEPPGRQAAALEVDAASPLMPAQPAVPPAAPAAAPPPDAGASLEADEGFTVQIAALRDRDEAIAVMRRLASQGYPAYVLDPVPGASTQVYRVRVGCYADRDAAEQVVRRLEQEEQISPWITR